WEKCSVAEVGASAGGARAAGTIAAMSGSAPEATGWADRTAWSTGSPPIHVAGSAPRSWFVERNHDGPPCRRRNPRTMSPRHRRDECGPSPRRLVALASTAPPTVLGEVRLVSFHQRLHVGPGKVQLPPDGLGLAGLEAADPEV